jgi:hypothetical protein
MGKDNSTLALVNFALDRTPQNKRKGSHFSKLPMHRQLRLFWGFVQVFTANFKFQLTGLSSLWLRFRCAWLGARFGRMTLVVGRKSREQRRCAVLKASSNGFRQTL